ncbi:MAG: 16S rRNA processing protein RimM [Firmicutes bacterium HGW-Firmicutes-1]|jgi:16S rRNA processing protein RimM|nr:MAG: 16S rRNA processing protein RimM [Firmicutes bacterium HGW-Firmicutes-1]
MEEFLYVGRVANTHGVQGAIKVIPTTDDPKRFELLKKIYIEDIKGNTAVYTIKSVKYLTKFVVLDLNEVADMNAAMLLKQGIVKIPRDEAMPLEQGEFYISDLIGIDVYDDSGKLLGPLKDIIFTGSNDVYVVDNGTRDGLLLPAIKQCIQSIDITNHKMIVTILEGLLN